VYCSISHRLNVSLKSVSKLIRTRLSEVRSLAGHLVVQPLLGFVVLLRAGGKADVVSLIVYIHQVLKDGTGFPGGDAGVRVLNGWEPTVRVNRLEGFLLQVGEVDELVLVVLSSSRIMATFQGLGVPVWPQRVRGLRDMMNQ
jgi:hypothetical protein